MKIAVSITALLLVLSGCAKNDSAGFETARLRDAVARNEAIELKKFTSFLWDRVHVYPPYAPPERIKNEVGKEVPFPHSWSEGCCLLVFVAGGSVVRSFEIGRRDADFSELYRSEGFTPEAAIFIVKQTKDGWNKLQKR